LLRVGSDAVQDGCAQVGGKGRFSFTLIKHAVPHRVQGKTHIAKIHFRPEVAAHGNKAVKGNEAPRHPWSEAQSKDKYH
jgi:hypothetical protein